jgi:predicted lysophospholipase L1 biosynthesis ABC-type transport system permease subunit
MGKLLLVGRLTARDLRRRPGQAVLLLLAIMAASATLTLGLALHGVTSHPYQQTRAATRGPDVTAELSGPPSGPHGPNQPIQVTLGRPGDAEAAALIRTPGVTGHSGPYLVAGALLRAHGTAALVQAEGRGTAPAAVDQPAVTSGDWVRPGDVVLERSFAEALRVGVGDRVTLNGQAYRVAGIAVTAATPPYPNLCYTGCFVDSPSLPSLRTTHPGLAWLTEADARHVAASDPAPPPYVLNLRLSDPTRAQAFADTYDSAHPGLSAPFLTAWPSIAAADGLLVQDEQQVLAPGAWLLGLLAVASVAVLVGGRIAEQNRRTGLLKAVGATPGLVALVLLAENLVLALAAAAAGLVAGWLAAPLLTSPGAGLVGTPGAPSLTLPDAALVVALAIAVALAATLVPAIRAARTSTVRALADAARTPKRRAMLIAVSARLPVPLLLGLRLIARRPRRAVLGAVSMAVTVTGIVAVLAFHATADHDSYGASGGLANPVAIRDEQVLTVITVMLLTLAALNVIFTAWATALDARHSSSLTRALGATPQQVSTGLSAAQLLPALPGAIIGIPAGIGLFAAANGASIVTVPPAWWLAAAVLGTLLAVAVLTAVPARIGGRRPVGPILQAETS